MSHDFTILHAEEVGEANIERRGRCKDTLQVPGSPSSAFTTKYFGLDNINVSIMRSTYPYGGQPQHYLPSLGLFINDHLRPEGKPAPPRPRRPDFLTSSRMKSLPSNRISFVLYQEPYGRAMAVKKLVQKPPYRSPYPLLSALDAPVILAIQVLKDAVLILQASIVTSGNDSANGV